MANRQYTAQDAEQINQAQEHFRAKGLADDQFQSAIDLLRDYFEANPTVPITVENVIKVVESRKQDFKWLSRAELELRKFGLNEDQNATLHTFLQNNTLEADGDPGFQNSVELLNWLQRNGRSFGWAGLALALGNVQNSQRGQYLTWKKRLQDSEKEELRRRSEQSQFAKPAEPQDEKSWRDKSRHPDPTLQYHKEMLGRKAETVAPDPAVETARTQREYEQKSKALVAHTIDGAVSHMDQRQMDRLFVTRPDNSIDWAATYHSRLLFLQRRTNERASAGRRG